MLKPFVFGLNYQTASLELRNRLAFSVGEIPSVLNRLLLSGIVKEVLLLSTCNRTEIYCTTNDINFVINALCDMHNLCPRNIRKHSYVYEDYECAKHLFRVISGLDSMVLGENEIVAQIKSAMKISSEVNGMGSILMGLFQMALSIEKEVRNNSAINNVAISMGNAVINYVQDFLPKVTNRSVLFIGAGQMMEQIAPHFLGLELDNLLILNRTIEKAEALASRLSATVDSLVNIEKYVANYPVVIVCCAANSSIISKNLLKRHHCSHQLFIDLSMPMVVDRDVVEVEGVTLLTIDHIAQVVDVGLEKRKQAAWQAEAIINEKIDSYHGWQRKRNLAPLIKRLRDNAEELRQQVLLNSEKDINSNQDFQDVLNKSLLLFMNKMLHQPTVNLASGIDGYANDEISDLVVKLYNL